MIKVLAQGPGVVQVTFRMRCGVGGHEVSVVGEFNDWSLTAHPMTFDGYAYVAEVVLPTGRAYRFRYLVNGERWQIDWGADRFVSNEVGGCDSILDLTSPRPSMLASTRPVTPTDHAGSALNRAPTEPITGATRTGATPSGSASAAVVGYAANTPSSSTMPAPSST